MRWYSPPDWVEGGGGGDAGAEEGAPRGDGMVTAASFSLADDDEDEGAGGATAAGAEGAGADAAGAAGAETAGGGAGAAEAVAAGAEPTGAGAGGTGLPHLAPAGQLSRRMTEPGNLWLELWVTAAPVPVSRQTPLFDDVHAGEEAGAYTRSLFSSN